MTDGGNGRDSRAPHAPLWPYIAAAALLTVLAGGVRLEQQPWGWGLRFLDLALLAAYGRALWRRSQCAVRPTTPLACDAGVVTAGALAVGSAILGVLTPV